MGAATERPFSDILREAENLLIIHGRSCHFLFPKAEKLLKGIPLQESRIKGEAG
jgi:hypothetical protein